MSSNTQETLIEKVKALPAEKQKKVLLYVELMEQSKEQPRKSIWEDIREIAADVPDEVWERLPRDGAEQHDHYLYGSPKK